MDGMEVMPPYGSVREAFDMAEKLGPIDAARLLLALHDRGDYELTREHYDALMKIVTESTKLTKQERQFEQIMDDMQELCDFVTIRSLACSQLSMWYHLRADTHRTFKPFREEKALPIIYKAFKHRKYSVSNQKAKSIYDTLKIAPAAQYNTIPQEIIRVSENLYWNTKKATLIEEAQLKNPCFRELFDSSGQTNIHVPIDEVQFDPAAVSVYTRLIAKNGGVLPDPRTLTADDLKPKMSDYENDIDFLTDGPLLQSHIYEDFQTAVAPFIVWAAEGDKLSVDTMNDLLKVYAVPFLHTPPKWFVYYIGDTRNGKSSCIKCQRVLLGLDNTSGFAMPALFDAHNSNHVLVTMLNAADEDYDFAPKDMQQGLANFKKAATHDEIDLPMFYSQDSTVFTPMFLSIFSRNSLPNFGEGDGAQAITKRMRAIFFKNDLSKFDSNGHDFEKETFTPEYYSKFVPIALAFARYYNGRTLELSTTCRNNSGLVEAASDPASFFFNELCYWFNYTSKGDFVIDQAKRFFQENGIQYSNEIITAIKNKIAQCEVKRLRAPYLGGPERVRLATLPNKLRRNRLPALAPDAVYSVFGDATFDQWHRKENERLAKMSAAQAYDDNAPAPSIFALLRDLEDDGFDPAVMQKHLEEKERKIAAADIDEQGNLIDKDGNILNGLI